jgi:hypothetical protein
MSPRFFSVGFALLLGSVAAFAFSAKPGDAPKPPRFVSPKVLVLNYDPIIESEDGKRLSEVAGWNDSHQLAKGYIDDLRKCSGGFLRCKIVAWKDLDAFPVKQDGFRYDDASYLSAFRKKTEWHQPDAVDYDALLRENDIPRRIESGEIDEVWTFTRMRSGSPTRLSVGRVASLCKSRKFVRNHAGDTFINH